MHKNSGSGMFPGFFFGSVPAPQGEKTGMPDRGPARRGRLPETEGGENVWKTFS